MKLQTALLLSSKMQAEAFVYHENSIVVRRGDYARYRLLVTEQRVAASDSVRTFLLEIYYVTYPDKKPGKGWGKPVYATTPHVRETFGTSDELISFLHEHEFSTEKLWEPIEEVESEEEEEYS